MGVKLKGMLNLSKIRKDLIVANKNLDKVIWVDIVPNKEGADKYGNTHSIQVWDKENRKAIYLGNLRPEEFGKGSEGQSAPTQSAPQEEEDGFPF